MLHVKFCYFVNVFFFNLPLCFYIALAKAPSRAYFYPWIKYFPYHNLVAACISVILGIMQR